VVVRSFLQYPFWTTISPLAHRLPVGQGSQTMRLSLSVKSGKRPGRHTHIAMLAAPVTSPRLNVGHSVQAVALLVWPL